MPAELVRVIGPRWSARSHELRDLLGRNNIPYGFYDAEGEDGRRLLTQARVEATDQPVLLLLNGWVLVDPTSEQLAQALGSRSERSLSGTEWQLTRVVEPSRTWSPPPEVDAVLRFDGEGHFSATACNHHGGPVRIDGDLLHVGQVVGTQMGCGTVQASGGFR